MKKIKAKLKELEQLFNDYQPTNEEKRKFMLMKRNFELLNNVSNYESRVKSGTKSKAQKAKPKPIQKKKRGRPKKSENLLATSAKPKTLVEKLKKDAK